MWKLLKFLVWTALATGLGIALATYEVGGKTPVQHFQRVWKQNGMATKLDGWKIGAREAFEDGKDSISRTWDKKPTERHSRADREAIEKLVAKRNQSK
jgi:hypothetical protein